MEQQNENKTNENSLFFSQRENSSKIYQKIINNLTDGIFITDKNDTIVFCNSSLGLILGKANYNLIGVNLLKSFDGDNYQDLIKIYLDVKKEAKTENIVVELNSNSTIPMFISCFLIPLIEDNGLEGIIGIIKNVSQKSKEEKELIVSHTVLQDAEKLTKAGSWDWNIDTGKAYWSDNCFRIHGINKADGVPDFTEYLKLVISSEQEHLSKKITDALGGLDIYNVEYKIITRDDHSVKLLHSFGYVLIDEFNSQHLKGITVDITEKKSEEHELDKKISDLEKFNKYMIGREERMVALKKEVNELRAKLKLPKKYFSHDETKELN